MLSQAANDGRMIHPERGAFRDTHDAGRPQLVWTRTVADTDTPVSAMLKLARPRTGAFILESVEGGTVRGRYTMLGFDPDLAFRVQRGTPALNRRFQEDSGAFELVEGDPLALLRTLVEDCRMAMPEALPPAFSTLVGYLGYESAGLIETGGARRPATGWTSPT